MLIISRDKDTERPCGHSKRYRLYKRPSLIGLSKLLLSSFYSGFRRRCSSIHFAEKAFSSSGCLLAVSNKQYTKHKRRRWKIKRLRNSWCGFRLELRFGTENTWVSFSWWLYVYSARGEQRSETVWHNGIFRFPSSMTIARYFHFEREPHEKLEEYKIDEIFYFY